MNLVPHGLLLQVIAWLVNFQHGFRLCAATEPGYLDFDNLPETNFSCQGKVIGGYYADIETGCQMFHVCTVGQKDEIMDIKFLCLNGTVFDQETRVCERVDEVDCSKSEKFYNLNLELYGNNAVTLSLHDETDEEDEPTESIDEQYSTSNRPTVSSTSTTTPRPTNPPSTASTSYHQQQPSNGYYPSSQPSYSTQQSSQSKSLYDDKNSGFHRQYIFHNGEQPSNQATSFQLFSNQGISSTTNVSPQLHQVHQVRFSSTSGPRIVHEAPSTVSSIFHGGSSTIQTLLNGNANNNPSLINPIFHNHGLVSTTEHYQVHSNNPRETQEYHHTGDVTGPEERRPLEAVQSTNQGKVSKLSISPVPTESEPPRQDPKTIPSGFVSASTTPEPTVKSFYPTPRTSSKPNSESVPIVRHVHLPPPPPIPQLKPQQITINLPPPDTQSFVQNPSPLLPSQSRVIVTAKATVSDESGRPLNDTQLVTLPLTAAPANYDDYKEGDESLDPFYRDVPKIRSLRELDLEKYLTSAAQAAKAAVKEGNEKRRRKRDTDDGDDDDDEEEPEYEFDEDDDAEEDEISDDPDQVMDIQTIKANLNKFKAMLLGLGSESSTEEEEEEDEEKETTATTERVAEEEVTEVAVQHSEEEKEDTKALENEGEGATLIGNARESDLEEYIEFRSVTNATESDTMEYVHSDAEDKRTRLVSDTEKVSGAEEKGKFEENMSENAGKNAKDTDPKEYVRPTNLGDTETKLQPEEDVVGVKSSQNTNNGESRVISEELPSLDSKPSTENDSISKKDEEENKSRSGIRDETPEVIPNERDTFESPTKINIPETEISPDLDVVILPDDSSALKSNDDNQPKIEVGVDLGRNSDNSGTKKSSEGVSIDKRFGMTTDNQEKSSSLSEEKEKSSKIDGQSVPSHSLVSSKGQIESQIFQEEPESRSSKEVDTRAIASHSSKDDVSQKDEKTGSLPTTKNDDKDKESKKVESTSVEYVDQEEHRESGSRDDEEYLDSVAPSDESDYHSSRFSEEYPEEKSSESRNKVPSGEQESLPSDYSGSKESLMVPRNGATTNDEYASVISAEYPESDYTSGDSRVLEDSRNQSTEDYATSDSEEYPPISTEESLPTVSYEDHDDDVLRFTDEIPEDRKKEPTQTVASDESKAGHEDYVDDNYEPAHYPEEEPRNATTPKLDSTVFPSSSVELNDEGAKPTPPKDDAEERFVLPEETTETTEITEITSTTSTTTTTTPKPTSPSLYRPISLRKNYNYIPPTTTPTPVMIKHRFGLTNPRPYKPPKSYNELAPKPVIRKHPSLARKKYGSTTTTTKSPHPEVERPSQSEIIGGTSSTMEPFVTESIPELTSTVVTDDLGATLTREENINDERSTTTTEIESGSTFVTESFREANEESTTTEVFVDYNAKDTTSFVPTTESSLGTSTLISVTPYPLLKIESSTTIVKEESDVTTRDIITERSETTESSSSVAGVTGDEEGVTSSTSFEETSLPPVAEDTTRMTTRYERFSCLDKDPYKFYGDPRDCRLFHFCSPGFTTRQMLDFRFVCENETRFDEETQSCRSDANNLKCDDKW